MRLRTPPGAPAAVLFLLVILIPFGSPSLRAQEATRSIQCVNRQATLRPPRATLPSLRSLRGKPQEFPRPRRLQPVCPSGQVPVVAPPKRRYLPKGNPLIGNYAAPGPARALSGEFIRRNLLLPFDQVYWKREGAAAHPQPKPTAGSGDPPCAGVSWFGSCFYYGSSAETRLDDGGGMTYTIEDPAIDNSGDAGGHTIAEIAVQGGPQNGDDVEMGWSVSPDQFGDTHPHLFVYHWINWNQTCYNTCAWNQYSGTYFPGMDLSALVGQNLYIGWVHYQGA